MPTYLYKVTYRGESKSVRIRKSNPKGWIGQVVGEAFPELATQEPDLLGRVIRAALIPETGRKGEWHLSFDQGDSGFALDVAEIESRLP